MEKKCKKTLTLFCSLFVFSAVAGALGPIEKRQVENEEKIWARAGFVKPNIAFIDVNKFYEKTQQIFTHSFDLTLVVFRGTEWSKTVVLRRLKKAADIYAQCGVRLGQVKLVEAGAPGGVIDFFTPGFGDVVIAQKVPSTFRPVLFYFRSIPKLNAYSWPENTDEDVADALKDTAWISLSAAMDLNTKIRDPKYVSEAHELGHILLNSLAHAGVGVSNLMAENFKYENGQLTSDQCRKIKEHRLVTPINKY